MIRKVEKFARMKRREMCQVPSPLRVHAPLDGLALDVFLFGPKLLSSLTSYK